MQRFTELTESCRSVLQTETTRSVRRRRHHHEGNVRFENRLVIVARRAQSMAVSSDSFSLSGFLNRRFTAVDGIDHASVCIHADDTVAAARDGRREAGPEFAQTNNGITKRHALQAPDQPNPSSVN